MIVGQDEVLEQILIAMFCRAHTLVVGVPGLAKTLIVRTLARTMNLDFKRIQFTPDLMPSDITGTEILQIDPETQHREFKFIPGPIFTNILLADEINRTPPKTQAALLECMQEYRVTSARRTYNDQAAVLRARDAEPDRAGRDVPAARGAARPVHAEHHHPVSVARGGDRDHPADDDGGDGGGAAGDGRGGDPARCSRSSGACR